MKQVIVEGVTAIVFLDRQSEMHRKLSIQLFDLSTSPEVRYDGIAACPLVTSMLTSLEYADVEPHVGIDLVTRALNMRAPPPMSMYGAPPQLPSQSYGMNPGYGSAQPPPQAANVANVLGSLPPATLQKVLGALAASPPASSYPANQPPPQQHYMSSGQGAAPAQQVQSIMDQLARLQNNRPM